MMHLFKRRRPNLYIIENNDKFRLTMEMMIARQYEINTYDFSSYEDCIAAKEPKPDIILMDHQLPGINGPEAIPLLKQKWPRAEIIVISSLEDTRNALRLLKSGMGNEIENTASEELFGSINKAMVNLKFPVAQKNAKPYDSISNRN